MMPTNISTKRTSTGSVSEVAVYNHPETISKTKELGD
jgi:hypothetical protein